MQCGGMLRLKSIIFQALQRGGSEIEGEERWKEQDSRYNMFSPIFFSDELNIYKN